MDYTLSREDLIMLTSEWKGERFEDGRPKVPQSTLDRIRRCKTEEAWKPLHDKGYKYQFEGELKKTNPDPNYVMVGRALTVSMLPTRPDVHMNMLQDGWDKGYSGFFNQWAIAKLQEDDVLVVDMFDKNRYGTFVGGNLSTAIHKKTKRGGAVVWGAIRDLQQINEIPDLQIYYRSIAPEGLRDVLLQGINRPCRIGKAICMPGDVVLATCEGVLFIPAHLAEEVAEQGEKTQVKDIFGFERIKEGKYTSAEIDVLTWSKDVMDDFQGWLKTSPNAKPFQHLNWEKEIAASANVGKGQFTGLA